MSDELLGAGPTEPSVQPEKMLSLRITGEIQMAIDEAAAATGIKPAELCRIALKIGAPMVTRMMEQAQAGGLAQ